MIFIDNLYSSCEYTFIPIIVLDKNNLNYYVDFYSNDFNLTKSNGVIFFINKNSVNFKDLLILKNLIIKLYNSKKLFGIYGIPHCLLQQILTPLYYTFLKPHFLKLNFLSFNYFNLSKYNSVQKLSCKYCFNANNCDGLGNLSENLKNNPNFRLHQNYRYLEKKKLFLKIQKLIIYILNF